ncbi:hypothetical protein KCU65_g2385, partial [Aureobasidium melanogenum]
MSCLPSATIMTFSVIYTTHHQANFADCGSQGLLTNPCFKSDQKTIDEKSPTNHEDHEVPSPELGSSDGDSEMTSIKTAAPTPVPQIRIHDPKKNNWGNTHRPRKSDCDACGSGKGSHGFACSGLRQRALDKAFGTFLRIVQHFLTYMLIDDALKALKKTNPIQYRSLSPDMIPEMPSVMMTMGLDWDTTCAHPFLKRLLNLCRLEEEIVCVEGSEHTDGGVDMILGLKGSFWREHQTKGNASNPIPICPIMVQKSPYEDPMERLNKWCLEYFDYLEQIQIPYDENRWPLPYFVVDGNWWKVGFAIRVGSTVELYDEEIGSMGWVNGVRKVMFVLQYVIKSTAERHREWYLEHGHKRTV